MAVVFFHNGRFTHFLNKPGNTNSLPHNSVYAINLKLAMFMLEKAGYKLTVAKNGQQAIDIFTANPDSYDLIFMDVQMPVMDGKTASRKLRQMGYNDIAIVAMTADAMKGDREKCLEAGMNDYIPKPIKRDEVFKIVKKWCLDRGKQTI